MRERNELPTGWIACSVGDVIELHYGKALPEKMRDADGMVPVFGSSGQVGLHSSALVEGPCIIVGRKGTAGAVEFSKDDCWPIDTTYFIRPPEHTDIRFLFHLLTSLRLEKLDRSTAIPGLNRDDAYSLAIWIPPLNEQRRIVEKIETLLARLDQGEAALRHTQTLLARYRQSVLKAAVTGALTADWRAQNAHRVEHGRDLLARILQTRRETWQGRGKYKEPTAPDTTGLPELPEGWVWATVDMIGEVITGGTPPTSKKEVFYGGPIPFLKPTDLDQGDQIIFAREYLTQNGVEKSRTVKRDAVLVTSIGATTGKAGISRFEKAAFNQQINAISPYGQVALGDYLYWAVIEGGFQARIWQNAAATTLPIINKSKFSRLAIALPSLDEQRIIIDRITRRVSECNALQRWCQTELIRSAALRQSILKDAFAGKLVPQNPSDEPAAELLARIRASRPAPARKKARA